MVLKLCIVLEATACMQQHWNEMRLHYLEPLLRHIDKGGMGVTELSLVLFRSRGLSRYILFFLFDCRYSRLLGWF